MRQWTIDAFAAEPFKGNPACVVEPLGAWPAAARMQALAAENNQAETAFLLRTDDPARFGLVWARHARQRPSPFCRTWRCHRAPDLRHSVRSAERDPR